MTTTNHQSADAGLGLGIKAASIWLPQGVEGAPGDLAPADLERAGYKELFVAPDDVAPPQMAVLAAQGVLDQSGIEPAAIGMLTHAFSYHQGFDMWSPAHYIAHQVGIDGALPINMQQLCNGGGVAVYMAAKWLLATPGTEAALVTAGDRFSAPGFDRWSSDEDAVYSDSGTAVLLGRAAPEGDLLRLLSLEMVTDSEWEIQMRGDDEFTSVPLAHGTPIDLRRANTQFRQSGAAARMLKTAVPKMYELIHRALGNAGVGAEDLSCVALPRLTRNMREGVFKPAVTEILGATASPRYLECTTGCLGAGDFLGNLVDIEEALNPGEFGMLIQGTAGYTFTCSVVQAPAK